MRNDRNKWDLLKSTTEQIERQWRFAKVLLTLYFHVSSFGPYVWNKFYLLGKPFLEPRHKFTNWNGTLPASKHLPVQH